MKISKYAVGCTLFGVLLISLAVEQCTPRKAWGHSSTPSTFYTFSSGEALTAAKLNTNFQHIHNTLAAGITDANIAPGAAIQVSKIAGSNLLPKAMAYVTSNTTSPCQTGGAAETCVINQAVGISTVYGTGTVGVYRVNLSYTPANAPIIALVTVDGDQVTCAVRTLGFTAPQLEVRCKNTFDTTAPYDAANTRFSLIIYGN